jgi:hypothetical protein
VANSGGVPELVDRLKSDVIAGSNDWHGHTRQGVDWHVYIGDACKVLPILEDESFNCVVHDAVGVARKTPPDQPLNLGPIFLRRSLNL